VCLPVYCIGLACLLRGCGVCDNCYVENKPFQRFYYKNKKTNSEYIMTTLSIRNEIFKTNHPKLFEDKIWNFIWGMNEDVINIKWQNSMGDVDRFLS